MKDVNVYIEPAGNEVTIREGKALEPKAPLPIDIEGTLPAPSQFRAGKVLDPLKCHIRIFKDQGRIMLVVDDTNPYSRSVIEGTLTKNVDLEKFQINGDARWRIQEFLRFVKMNRYFFADRAAHERLVGSLQTWSARIERVIQDHNDQKGNTLLQLETKVRTMEGFVGKFDLLIPIFQGYEKKKFTVEIGLDPKNTEVQIYLFSDELIELTLQERERLIETELRFFDDFPCSKVVIS